MKDLRDYTSARVRLGLAGDSLPTRPLLALRLAYARARDAVQMPLNVAYLQAEMHNRNWPSLVLRSAVENREEYLLRPDLGRILSPDSASLLSRIPQPHSIVFVVADGLSALAIERHAIPLMERVFELLPHTPVERNPVFLVNQGRVARGDKIGELLAADATVMLIGERPGLSSPDRLGVYLTWQPRSTYTDANRNCISNIHASGLSYAVAAHKLVFLLREMFCRKLSGVLLKDTSAAHLLSARENDILAVLPTKREDQ